MTQVNPFVAPPASTGTNGATPPAAPGGATVPAVPAAAASAAAAPPQAPATTPPAPVPPRAPDDDDDLDDALGIGAAGKRAVTEIRSKLRDERRDRRAAEARADTLARELAAAHETSKGLASLRRSILEHAVAATAAGRLSDPLDAMRLIDLSDVTVGDDGQVDLAKLREKVDALVKTKPYLATVARPPQLPGASGTGPPPSSGMNDLLRRAIRGDSG